MERTPSRLDAVSVDGSYSFAFRSLPDVLRWNWPFNLAAIAGATVAEQAHISALAAVILGAAITAPASMAAVKLLNGSSSAQIRAASWSLVLAIVTGLAFSSPSAAQLKTFPGLIILCTCVWLKVKLSALPYVAAFGEAAPTRSLAQTWRLFSWERWWMFFGLGIVVGIPSAIVVTVMHLITRAIDPSQWLYDATIPVWCVLSSNFLELTFAYFTKTVVAAAATN